MLKHMSVNISNREEEQDDEPVQYLDSCLEGSVLLYSPHFDKSNFKPLESKLYHSHSLRV